MNPKENSDIHGETATSSDNTSQGAAMSPVSTSSETGTPASSQVLVPNMDASGKPPDGQQPQLLFKKCEMRMLFQIDHTRINPQCRGNPDVTMVGTTADATSPPTSSMCTSSISTIEGSPKNVEGYTPSTSAVTKTSETTQVLVPNMDASGKPPDVQPLPAPYGTSEVSSACGVDYNCSHNPHNRPPSIIKVNGIPIPNTPPNLYAGPQYQPTTGKTAYFEHGFGTLTDDQIWKIVKVVNTNRWLYKYRHVRYMLMDEVYVRYNKLFMVQAILNLIIAMYGFEPTSCSICDYILKEAMCRADYFYGTPNDERFTFFLNGYVDNQTGQLLARVPDYFPTIKVQANYIDHPYILHHPLTDKFFNDIAGGDPVKIVLLWQCLGYCISSDAKAKVIFILWGPKGDNGKSTYISYIQSFLTPSGVKNLSMKNLLGSRFAMSELEFARVNASADEGTMCLNMEALGQLKNLSGHDYINGDVKGQEQTRFLSTCKILIASNNNISVGYTTSDPAFKRRLVTIPFEVSIPKEKQDPNLLNKLMAERDAVATRAMKCYLKLKANNYQFSGREQFNNMLHFAPSSEEYDLIRNFSECYCDFSDSEAFTPTQDLYTAFRNVYGDTFKDVTAFSQAFNRANESRKIIKHKKRTSAGNCWVYRGVTLKEAL